MMDATRVLLYTGTIYAYELMPFYGFGSSECSAVWGISGRSRFLAGALGLPDYKYDPRQATKVDYATYVLNYGKKLGLSPVKISTLFTIAQSLLAVAERGELQAKAQEVLRNFLVGLCDPFPTPEDYKFSPQQIASIGSFFAEMYFRHYRKFFYMYNYEQPRQETDVSLLVETVRIHQDFGEAFTEEGWKQYNDDIVAAAEAEKAAEEQARVEAEEAERKFKEAQEAQAAELKKQQDMERIPNSLDEAVNKMVLIRLAEERHKLEKTYKAREDELLQRIATLESSIPKTPAPAGGRKR